MPRGPRAALKPVISAGRRTALASLAAGLLAFFLYHATLLPGLDFGDTPSFQVMAGDTRITPRDAYPLYFALGAPFTTVVSDRARALNLASAVEGAVAASLLTLVGVELTGSALAAMAGALLFAASYTFWSQSIIAEVYALHACMFALSLLLLLRWERRPTLPRLAAFFAAYAIGFGNHLGTVLLLPAYTAFLLWSAPGGWRTMFAPRIVALAAGLALLGALQYAWNLRALWLAPVPPHSLGEAISRFWYDVTKVDWRESMVARVPSGMAGERLRMYAFDLRQQFGVAGPLLATAGAVSLSRRSPRRAVLLAALYAVNAIFALTYNVGDSHVFFLPSHLVVALLVAIALASIDSWLRGSVWRGFPKGLARGVPVAGCAGLLLAGMTMYGNYPALDRSRDTRPADLLSAFTAAADDNRAIVITALNWQVENGLNYFLRDVRRDIAAAHIADVLPHAPRLIEDNARIRRAVLLSSTARDELMAAYPSRYRAERDTRAIAPTLTGAASRLRPGTRYVLTVLKPTRTMTIDRDDLGGALRALGAGAATLTLDRYEAVAGLAGQPPVFAGGSAVPFRRTIELAGTPVDIRMESWLAFDTIRRMGFGQIVAHRRHTLIVERGVSLVAFDEDGRPLETTYAASLFAPEPRWAIVDP